MTTRLVIISPCKDEEQFVEITLRCMVAQTRQPDRWVIVDDGSVDKTAEIVSRYSEKHPWIEIVRRNEENKRELGPGVVAVFKYGMSYVADDPYEVICKLDADLEFEPDFIKRILKHFSDPQVGVVGPGLTLKSGSILTPERYAGHHVPGAAKFYRRQCYEQIGGPQQIYGWDIADVTEARRLGWKTLSDPEINVFHLRLQGATLGSVRGRVVWGQGAYAIGSHPIFAIARGFYRMFERPFFIGGLAFIWGFFSSYFKPQVKRTANGDLIKFVRKEQMYRLFHGNKLPPQENRK